MNSTNIFLGMNSDVARIYQNEKEYLSCKNMRPVTTLGGSNGSLVNIKGNECQITFPLLRSVYKLAIVLNEIDDEIDPGTIEITVNVGFSQTTGTITIDGNTTTSDIKDYLALLPSYYDGTYTGEERFTTAYNSEYIYIYQNPYYTGCEPDTSYTPVITITQLSGTSTVKFIDSNNVLTTTQTAHIPASTSPLVIIGSTFINETIYLFTCGTTSSSGLGQIWELEYDQPTSATSVKLLYNNYVNFTKEFPIPPTAAVGRYEVPTVQRIYWSDNNNPIRSVNVKDPNLFAVEPEIMNMRPSVEMNIPTLQGISDSGAVTGLATWATYQCAYRLTKFNGAITNYSPLSNMVYLTPTAIAPFGVDNFSSLSGDSSIAINKSIHWEVSGVDTNFDNIEFVILIRTYPNTEDFTAYKYETIPISGNETILTTFTNDSSAMEEISMEEFLIDNTSFTHCKTIEQKDNRLFFGNVRSTLGDYLETFDTRVYRFGTGSDINTVKVKARETDTTVTTFNISDPTDYDFIDETDDNIPVYNLDLDGEHDSNYDETFKYQSDGVTIGGTGPNISFKFGNLLIRSDQQHESPVTSGGTDEGTSRDVVGTVSYPHGFRVPGTTTDTPLDNSNGDLSYYSNLAPNQKFYTRRYKQTMGLEYFSGNFRTGQHNEIYRYGIVFTSKQGTKYFAKWIGDIKFPNYSDSVASGLEGYTDNNSVCSDFRSVFVDASGAYCNIPYIQFEVNIPSELANIISGYEIVRVKRNEEDRTICSHGLINQVALAGGSDNSTQLPSSHYLEDPSLETDYLDPSTSLVNAYGWGSSRVITFHPFKDVVDRSTNSYSNSDRLIVTERYKYTTPSGAAYISPSTLIVAVEERYAITKFYTLSEFIYKNSTYEDYQSIGISEAQFVDKGADSNSLSVTGDIYKNYNIDSGGDSSSVGCATIVIGTTDTVEFQDFGNGTDDVHSSPSNDSNSKIFGIHYKPSRLKNQYGGRTYAARNNSEYISTGAFYTVTEAGTTTINVFGGDMFHGILNIQKAIKNWSGPLPSAAQKFSQTWYFATQSYYNLDLRNGIHVNRDLNTDDGNGASDNDEYAYDSYYSYENVAVTYVPKPLLFNETSSFFNRVCWSNVKINGETSDSWVVTPTDNVYDLEGNYGPINALITLKGNMYSIQDRALAVLLVNPQAILQDPNGTNLVMGNGETLDKHQYLALDAGTKHQWSVSKSSDAITFIDANKRKIYMFNGQSLTPISDTKGQRGFINKVLHGDILTTDNPIIATGIVTTYDYLNNEFLYTFHGEGISGGEPVAEQYTLVFSDITGAFSAHYDFKPYIYINNNNIFYTPLAGSNDNNRTKLYLHNVGNYCEFYGTIYPSSVKTVINKNPLNTKVFDNLSWLTESIEDNEEYWDDITDLTGNTNSDNINHLDDTIKRIRCYNEYQNTDWVDMDQTAITGNLRKTEQGFNTYVPRNKVNYDTFPINTTSIFSPAVLTKTEFGERMRDKHMVVDLEYDNETGNRFILHNLSSTFRVSDR